MKYIKTQKELDALCKRGIKEGEEYEISGTDLEMKTDLEVFGFIRVSVAVKMGWHTNRLVLWRSSRAELRESSRAELWGSSSAVLLGSSSAVLRESSSAVLWESSRAELWESSRAELWGSSSAVLLGSSSAVLRDSSRAELWGSSVSWIWSAAVKVSLFGLAVAYKMIKGRIEIKKEQKTSTVIEVPPVTDSWDDYIARYPITMKDKTTAIMYKAVRKYEDGTYRSDYNRSFTYCVGETVEEVCAPSKNGACSTGIHVAFKSWARGFGAYWDNFALLECEVAVKDIVVSDETDGKVCASKVKVIREVPKAEWF